MANNYLTPGVYVQEISTLPGSVVEVQSAIPAFIGYTEKTRYGGRELQGIPEHIVSFKDFEERFGAGPPVHLDSVLIKTDNRGRFSQIEEVNFTKRFLLYEALFMFFANGGGECYVVSTGSYEENPPAKPYDPKPFTEAIEALNAVDDVTLLVLPEAVLLGESLYGVQQAALKHCATRQNRFAILDLIETSDHNKSLLLNWKNASTRDCWREGCESFRNQVGTMNLSYGAAYTPYVIADTRPTLNYQDLRNKLKDDPKTDQLLKLAALDPEAEKAVNYLDLAIGDMANLLLAVEETRDRLLKSSALNNTKSLLSLNDVIIAYNTRKPEAGYPTSIQETGQILGNMFGSLSGKNEPTPVPPKGLLSGLTGFEDAVAILSKANDQDNYASGLATVKSASKTMTEALTSAINDEDNRGRIDKLTTVDGKLKELNQAIGKLPENFGDIDEAAIKTVNDAVEAVKKTAEESYSPPSKAPKVLIDCLAGLEAAVDKMDQVNDTNYTAVRKEAALAVQAMNTALGLVVKAKKDSPIKDRLEAAQEKAEALNQVVAKLPDTFTTQDAVKEPIKAVDAAFRGVQQAIEAAYDLARPLTADLSRHLSNLLAQLKPKLKELSSPKEADTIPDLITQIPADNLRPLASLIDTLLCEDLYKSIVDNIARLSDGLYSTSAVYRSIYDTVQKALKIQPPSAVMAGLYANTDRARGVWKAPANISLSNCLGLTQTITALDQERLNVDSVAGKSINAIRAFPGKGYLVWGARTLDGNSQEWRYIPVRRFFIMVEESVRRATSASVFEPNDANLWSKVKGMIDNYLIQKWKDGALMGASPVDAFFVNVGLGSTMTEQDILEGRLIVDIGMAVVRPAEFIILRFMHKMQQA